MSEVTNTIYAQFGGARSMVMIGGSASSVDENTLGIRFKATAQNKSKYVQIHYSYGSDTYTVTFYSLRKGMAAKLETFDDIYADQLQTLFTNQTGLYLRL